MLAPETGKARLTNGGEVERLVSPSCHTCHVAVTRVSVAVTLLSPICHTGVRDMSLKMHINGSANINT